MSKTQYFTLVANYEKSVYNLVDNPTMYNQLMFYPCQKREPAKVRSFINTNIDAYMLWTLIYYIFKESTLTNKTFLILYNSLGYQYQWWQDQLVNPDNQ